MKIVRLLFVLLMVCGLSDAEIVKKGAGSITTTLPTYEGEVFHWVPSRMPYADQRTDPPTIVEDWTPATPQYTKQAKARGIPPLTHRFWSSVIWEYHNDTMTPDGVLITYPDAPYSDKLMAHPLSMQLKGNGMQLGYNPQAALAPVRDVAGQILPDEEEPQWRSYTYDFPGFFMAIEFEGLEAERTEVDDYTAWTTTVLWQNEENGVDQVRATMGLGLPFVYFEKRGFGDIVIKLPAATRIWYEADGTVALIMEAARTNYAFFLPKGSEVDYEVTNRDLQYVEELRISLPVGQRFFSVGVLPDDLNSVIYCRKEDSFEQISEGTKLADVLPYKWGTPDVQPVTAFYRDYFGIGGGYLQKYGGYSSTLPEEYYLADDLLRLLLDYRRHAFAVPVEAKVEWRIDQEESMVYTHFTIRSELRTDDPESINVPLLGLYPHQWRHMNEIEPTLFHYRSPRGELKVISATEFSTAHPYIGVLPNLPNPSDPDRRDRLAQYLDEVVDPENIQAPKMLVDPEVLDTYYNGKNLARVAHLIPIAEEMGRDDLVEEYLAKLKSELEDWFDASDYTEDRPYFPGAQKNSDWQRRYFYYDKEWKTLIGYPSSFGSDTNLNDHHFHYGYLIMAAATVARYDKEWAREYAEMVKLLIKDCTNWNEGDKEFAFLRNFDPYSGFFIAGGPVEFASGINQESSSEAMNYATALIHWGSEMGDKEIRDLGIYLYATQMNTLRYYWFDEDGKTFPQGWYLTDGAWNPYFFNAPAIGIVWGGKGDYTTWFGNAPTFIHGINFLPIHGGSLYLGHLKDEIEDVLEYLPSATETYLETGDSESMYAKVNAWSDIQWQAEALLNPAHALSRFEQNRDYPWELGNFSTTAEDPVIFGERGESKAHTYQWIASLRDLGTVVTDIRANTSHYAVFDKDGVRTYVAYNPTDVELTVLFFFTNGQQVKKLQVAPGELKQEQ